MNTIVFDRNGAVHGFGFVFDHLWSNNVEMVSANVLMIEANVKMIFMRCELIINKKEIEIR